MKFVSHKSSLKLKLVTKSVKTKHVSTKDFVALYTWLYSVVTSRCLDKFFVNPYEAVPIVLKLYSSNNFLPNKVTPTDSKNLL